MYDVIVAEPGHRRRVAGQLAGRVTASSSSTVNRKQAGSFRTGNIGKNASMRSTSMNPYPAQRQRPRVFFHLRAMRPRSQG
jgi:hypothetical protein